ncbi:hypothetical protein [Glycomyces algeriensis]|uniref:Uncharacterized protein n=1 Tax=Glycomyces algeriensis TaxID=256037 RepID=A0A9W6GAS4_9ACTN|nr:hypothetical protein [Glycomyces algeriensis]MDA1364568.1 hypothetical protein [Glycomyces algeriensis]MDR7350605.1 hypothetical protein [Glycomyces algeriensis]GLI43313.1 hypothetical protein GALLR39Z86_31630 [Glycomyces algeriensis]
MSRPSQPAPSEEERQPRKANWKRISIVVAAAAALFAATTMATAMATAPSDPAASPAVVESASSATEPSPTTEPPPDAAALAGPETVGDCGRTPSSTPEVTITEVDTGGVIGYGQEGDTEPLPMAIAARPGGSWLAWIGTDDRIHLGKLDCDDRLEGEPIAFEGIDLQDVIADEDGVVVLVTREGACGDGPLCGGESSPCNTMHMVRFDNEGDQVWEREVTNLGDGLDGYDDGARFVWWYQHHGRLATDGEHFAAYFGVAITVANGDCVDVHQGDRMQVVDADGDLVDHPDAFATGCSHSWTTRIVWDPGADEFAMVCATDNECRIARPDPYETVAWGVCDGTLFGGDLVLSSDGPRYWTAWSQSGEVRLERFSPSNASVDTGIDASHPHLVSYGETHMLLAWEDGDAMRAQVLGSGTGDTVGESFAIDVPDHDYQAFKAYDDGSAAYPAAGDGDTIRIARVMPLSS